METLDAIAARRSIRRFKKEIPHKDIIVKLLELALKAPATFFDREPRKFIVLEGNAVKKLSNMIMDIVLALNKEGINTGNAVLTARIIQHAPVIIMCFRANPPNYQQLDSDLLYFADIQSVSAAIENILLSATDLGLGSLWMGDVLVAENEIKEWLNVEEKLVAAVAIGYPNQSPESRPRKSWQEVTEWYDGNVDKE